MSFKKFLANSVKSLIAFVFVAFLFSSIASDFTGLVGGVLGDIFAYATPTAQKEIVIKLAQNCASGSEGDAVSIKQICTNSTLLEDMRQDCKVFRELKVTPARSENDAELARSCQQIESAEFERSCEQIRSNVDAVPDFKSIGDICSAYKSGKINDKEFFFRVISMALPSNISQQTSALKGYNNVMGYLNKNKAAYLFILLLLIGILYIIIREMKLFYLAVLDVSFNIGMIIMLPYMAIIAYNTFVGFDTTSILSSLLNGLTGFDPKALFSVILLLLLRTYNTAVLTLGLLFLSAGIFGKIYQFRLKKKNRQTDEDKRQKVDQLLDELEQEAKKKGR